MSSSCSFHYNFLINAECVPKNLETILNSMLFLVTSNISIKFQVSLEAGKSIQTFPFLYIQKSLLDVKSVFAWCKPPDP